MSAKAKNRGAVESENYSTEVKDILYREEYRHEGEHCALEREEHGVQRGKMCRQGVIVLWPDKEVRIGRHKGCAEINNNVTRHDVEEPAGDNQLPSRESPSVALLAPVGTIFQR